MKGEICILPLLALVAVPMAWEGFAIVVALCALLED